MMTKANTPTIATVIPSHPMRMKDPLFFFLIPMAMRLAITMAMKSEKTFSPCDWLQNCSKGLTTCAIGRSMTLKRLAVALMAKRPANSKSSSEGNCNENEGLGLGKFRWIGDVRSKLGTWGES